MRADSRFFLGGGNTALRLEPNRLASGSHLGATWKRKLRSKHPIPADVLLCHVLGVNVVPVLAM